MRKAITTFLLVLVYLGSSASWMPSGCARGDGAQLLFEAKRGDAASDEVMEATREIIERRIDALGSYGATVARQGPNRIIVTLGRREDAEQVKALIGRAGRLEFRLVDTSATREQLASGHAPPGSQILRYTEGRPDGRIAVQRRRIVTGRMVADANTAFTEQGQPSVIVRFDDAGSLRLARATQENVNRPLAIVLDNVVVSAPTITEPIVGGSAQIAGGFTVETSSQLAIALRSGALPIDLVLIEERVLPR